MKRSEEGGRENGREGEEKGRGREGEREDEGEIYRIVGIFWGGKIFVDMENFAGSWKKSCGYVYACTNERGSLHLW